MDIFSAPQPCPLCREDLCWFPQPPELTLCVSGPLVHLSWLTKPAPLYHGACVHLPQVPVSFLCATGIVCTSFASPAHPLFCRACVHLSQSLGPHSVSWGLCSLVLIPRPILYVPGFVCTSFTSLVCGLHQGACVHLSPLTSLPSISLVLAP